MTEILNSIKIPIYPQYDKWYLNKYAQLIINTTCTYAMPVEVGTGNCHDARESNNVTLVQKVTQRKAASL